MSPKFALGGTWPANVFVFPVTEPTMINLFCSAFALTLSLSNNNNANKWCAKWFTPTHSSKPCFVNDGTVAFGKYNAALQINVEKFWTYLDAKNFFANDRTESKSANSHSIT
jgi:hypothetical protein